MADPGDGPGLPPPPPLFLEQTEAQGAEKNFWRQGSPLTTQGLVDRVPNPPPPRHPPPLISRSGSGTKFPFPFFLLNFRWNRRSPSNMGHSGSRTFSLPYSFVPPWLSRNLGLFRRDQLFESGQCTRLDWISSKRKVLANEKTFDCSCGKQSGWNQ